MEIVIKLAWRGWKQVVGFIFISVNWHPYVSFILNFMIAVTLKLLVCKNTCRHMEVKCNVTLRCWDLNTSGIIKKIVMTCYPLKLCEDGAVSWSKQCVSLFIAALNNIILCRGVWMFPLEQKRTQAGFISVKTAVPCISFRYMISVDFFSHPLYVSWLPGWYWKAGLLYSRRSKSVLSLQSI